jgi:hypothetical protein
MVKRCGSGFAALGDATTQVIEARLWAYIAYVVLGLGMILVEFMETHKINTNALGIMGAACALTTFSIPRSQG